MSNSTFAGNDSIYGDGGAIQADGPNVVIDQSTFVGNSAYDSGGALYLFGGVTIRNSTITGNSADTVGGVAMGFAYSLTMVNTIVSGNSEYADEGTADLRVSDDIQNGPPGTELLVPEIDYSLVGVSTVDVAAAGTGNIVSSDPMLGALGDNGGDTETMVPLSGSPVIDAGDSSVASFDTDQRGQARVQGVIDIGAVEVQPAPPTTVPAPAILPPTGSGSRTGVLAALLTGFGAVLTLGASRRRRTN